MTIDKFISGADEGLKRLPSCLSDSDVTCLKYPVLFSHFTVITLSFVLSNLLFGNAFTVMSTPCFLVDFS